MNKTLSSRLRDLKKKDKSIWVIPKVGEGRLEERSLTRAFHYTVQTGFHKGGRN